MPALNDVSTRNFDQYEQVKPEELDGATFMIENVRGPYQGEYGEFLVFQIDAPGMGKRDLLLSYVPNSQRADLLEYFSAPGSEPVGPVGLVKKDIGKDRTFWTFVDAGDLVDEDVPF